jgi:hypothetical protein
VKTSVNKNYILITHKVNRVSSLTHTYFKLKSTENPKDTSIQGATSALYDTRRKPICMLVKSYVNQVGPQATANRIGTGSNVALIQPCSWQHIVPVSFITWQALPNINPSTWIQQFRTRASVAATTPAQGCDPTHECVATHRFATNTNPAVYQPPAEGSG